MSITREGTKAGADGAVAAAEEMARGDWCTLADTPPPAEGIADELLTRLRDQSWEGSMIDTFSRWFREREAAADEIERLQVALREACLATHRQAACIHYCAAHIGPETAATIDGLPRAVKALVARAEAAEAREAATERRCLDAINLHTMAGVRDPSTAIVQARSAIRAALSTTKEG